MLAAKLAALVALVATPALAQPPPSAYQPPSSPPANYQPLNYQNYQPTGGQPAAGQQQPGNYQNYQPASGQQQPGGLPLPPGYRPRTPPPQAQTRTTTAPGTLAGSGGGGQVMYFQKPADALTATGGSDEAGGAAQLGGARTGPAADVQGTTLPPLPQSRYLPTTSGSDFASAPPPPQPRYLPAPSGSDFASTPPPVPSRYQPAPGGVQYASPPPALVVSPVTTTAYDMQPKPKDPGSGTPTNQYKPVDPKYIQLPPRSEIFRVYNDAQLERSTIDKLYVEFVKTKQDSLAAKKADLEKKKAELKDETDPEKIKTLKEEIVRDEAEVAVQEKAVKDLQKDPDPSFRFPPLPVVGPPASAYQPKTVTYAPRKLIVEPGYYAHRKLYLEERNAERAGWDLGPMQTLVSAAYFWRDTLLMPQSFASACVYGHWDTSAGKCLPGSPSPYYLYPPGLTLTGTVAEGVLITGAGFIK